MVEVDTEKVKKKMGKILEKRREERMEGPREREEIEEEGEGDTFKCPDCGSTKLMTDHKHGEMICSSCGVVIEESMISFGAEWRVFDDDQKYKKERTGGAVKFSKIGKGVTTEIDRYDRDFKGGAIPTESKAQIYRLRKWQRRARMADSFNRNLSVALPELERMCAFLNVSDNIKEECAKMYRQSISEGLVRGRSIESIIAAMIYIVSRNMMVPKTLEKLEEASGVNKREIGRSYRFIVRNLGIKMRVERAADFIPGFASELGISGETEAKAVEILDTATRKGVTAGRGPVGMAAAALKLAGLLMGDKNAEHRRIVTLPGVTKTTIDQRVKQLSKAVDENLTEEQRKRLRYSF